MLKTSHLALSLLFLAGAGCGADDTTTLPDAHAATATEVERAPDNADYAPTDGEDLSAPESDLADASGSVDGPRRASPPSGTARPSAASSRATASTRRNTRRLSTSGPAWATAPAA